AKAVSEVGDRPVAITVLRAGERVTVTLEPRVGDEIAIALVPFGPRQVRDQVLEHAGQWKKGRRLGVLLEPPARVDVGLGTAAVEAVKYPVEQTQAILVGLYEWISGKQEGRISSVVGI